MPIPYLLCGAKARRVYLPLNFDMNGAGSRRDDPILQYQFKYLRND